jgi:RNA recognition motif-containing protein
MKIFIGRIPSHISAGQLEGYFAQYGKIVEFKPKGAFGFIEYESSSSADDVLSKREHVVEGALLTVEPAKGGKRKMDQGYPERYDGAMYRVPPRDYEYRYDMRSPPRYGARSPGGYGYRYDMRPMEYYPPPYPHPMELERQSCDYCSKCERHGLYGRGRGYTPEPKRRPASREHPNSHLKVVIENIPPGVTEEGFRELLRESGFETTYSRMGVSGTHGIFEFRTVEEKDNVMKKFDNYRYGDSVLRTRSYLTKDEYKARERELGGRTEHAMDEGIKEEGICPDLYTGIEEELS